MFERPIYPLRQLVSRAQPRLSGIRAVSGVAKVSLILPTHLYPGIYNRGLADIDTGQSESSIPASPSNSCRTAPGKESHHVTGSASTSGSSDSGSVKSASEKGGAELKSEGKPLETASTKKKTLAELDDELRMKLEGISGEGGAAGLEYENGKPAAMKRGVRENMFRLI
jgi:hypothetical protein